MPISVFPSPIECRIHHRKYIDCVGDVKPALSMLNEELQKEDDPASWYDEWRETVAKKREEFPMWFPKRDDVIVPQWAIKARLIILLCLCLSIWLSKWVF